MAYAARRQSNDSAEIAAGVMFMVYIATFILLAAVTVLVVLIRGTWWLCTHKRRSKVREIVHEGVYNAQQVEEPPVVVQALEEAPAPAPTSWKDRPVHLRGAAEIIAWHKVNGVPMPSYAEMAGRTPEDVMEGVEARRVLTEQDERVKADARARALRMINEIGVEGL